VRAELLSTTLSARLRRPVLVEVADSYEELEREVLSAAVEVAWAPPSLCARAEPTARAILRATRGGRSEYHSALICRADDPLTIDTLSGRRAAWVDRRSTGGYLLAAAHLRRLGRPPEKVLASESFYGSYGAALSAVLSGEADFTAIYVADVDHASVRATLLQYVGEDEGRLVAFECTAASPTDGLVITARTSAPDAKSLLEAILPDSSSKGPPTLLQVCEADSFTLARPGEFAALADAPGAISSISSASGAKSAPSGALIAAPKPLLLRFDRARRCVESFSAGASGSNPFVGQSLLVLFGESVARQISDAIDRALSRKEPAHVGFVVDAITGPAYLEVDVMQGASSDVCLSVSDVSERKRLEAELLSFASYPALDPDPCFDVVSPNGKDARGELSITSTNVAARRLFPDLLALRDHPLLRAVAPLVRTALDEAETVEGEVTVGDRVLHVTACPVPDGRSVRVYGVDVTRLTKSSPSRVSTRRGEVTQIARAVALEIEASIGLITQSLALVSEEVSSAGETGEHLDSVMRALDDGRDAGKRLGRLAERLGLLAKKDDEPRSLDVRVALEEALSLFPELGRRAELVRDLGDAPKVIAVEQDLVMVFLGLLVNAARGIATAGPRKKRHSVRLVVRTDAAGRAVVEVCDSGAGMAPERLARVFEDKELGLGASLAVVRSLGGELNVDSQVGQGTTFSVALPAGEASGLPRRR
jgi:two-component system NtrC family sensor kinase